RCRQQSRQLAVGRWLRRRCRALFPGVQPDPAGREVRSRRRLCQALGARTGPAARQIDPSAVERRAARTHRRRRETRQQLSEADRRSQSRPRTRARRLCKTSKQLNCVHSFDARKNQAIVMASLKHWGTKNMDDDKPVLETVTDAVSTAATATTEAAKTVVKKVKKAARKVAKKVMPKAKKKAKKTAKKSAKKSKKAVKKATKKVAKKASKKTAKKKKAKKSKR